MCANGKVATGCRRDIGERAGRKIDRDLQACIVNIAIIEVNIGWDFISQEDRISIRAARANIADSDCVDDIISGCGVEA